MRAITSTLQAAQRAVSSTPYVYARLSDYWGDRYRLRFARHYTGSEPADYAAACGTGDGSLIRAWINAGTLFTKRVATPGAGSDFAGAPVNHGAVYAAGGVAVFARGAAVLLVYGQSAGSGVTALYKTSSDNGATWSAAATVTAVGASKTAYAGAYATDGEALLVWNEGGTVYRSRWSGSAWGARTAWTNTVASCTGLATAYVSDWQIIVTGTESVTGDALVWGCIFGDGIDVALDTWSALTEISRASAGSGVSFKGPALAWTSADWRLFFVEAFSGDLAYNRLQLSTMDGARNLGQELWREPWAFEFETAFNVAAAGGFTAGTGGQAQNLGAVVWLSSSAGVWSAAYPSWGALDVAADVLEAGVELSEDGGRATIVLQNEGGRYTGYGSGTLAALQRGARLQLAPGYKTPAGAEASTGPAYWVQDIEVVTGPAPRVVLQARDAWWVLEQWRARRTYRWAAGAKTVSQLLQFVVSRAGLDYTALSSSAGLTGLRPAFVIHPGDSGKAAVQRLLRLVEDRAWFRGGTLWVRDTNAGDAADYAVGAAGGHAIVEARYRDATPDVNRVAVFGSAGKYGEAFDWVELVATSERLQRDVDVNLTASADATSRAAAALRVAQLEGEADAVTLFGVSCGQELYDAVSVTDAQAGLAAAARRVLGLRWWYEPERRRGPQYAMTLRLGAA